MKKQVSINAEKLQMRLSDLATQYRSSEGNSELHHQALKEYYTTFQQLVELRGGIVGLDPDAELPDHLMPKAYVDYWLNANDITGTE